MVEIRENHITELSVAGYKSIFEDQKIRVAPLTILAGANSSGKSSFMQPFLLMKQTLESPYDPGVFLLDGENVKLTNSKQMFSNLGLRKICSEFGIKIGISAMCDFEFDSYYEFNKDIEIKFQEYRINKSEMSMRLYPKMSNDEIIGNSNMLGKRLGMVDEKIPTIPTKKKHDYQYFIQSNRCFLSVGIKSKHETSFGLDVVISYTILDSVGYDLRDIIRNIIHLPGLRGNPKRTYPKIAVSNVFPGRFEVYTASIIHYWQTNKETEKILELENYLQLLGLSSKVRTNQIDDTKFEILVGRLPKSKKGKSKDWVNIADVGFGVSQTLPILVALVQAKQGQTVYIEQPETHLHPKAQYQLAQLFAKAAKRGVILIIETHSAILLRGVQTLVAKGELSHENVALHWFSRDKNGATKIDSADLDENGAFGDWPEDFDDTLLHVESEFLNAAESRG